MDGLWFSIGSYWFHIWVWWLWHEFRWSSLGAVVCGLSLLGSTLAQLWYSWFRSGSGGWPEFILLSAWSEFRGQSSYGSALVQIWVSMVDLMWPDVRFGSDLVQICVACELVQMWFIFCSAGELVTWWSMVQICFVVGSVGCGLVQSWFIFGSGVVQI